MKIVKSVSRMQQVSSNWKKRGSSIGFIPTMGALHQGHLSLIRQARRDNKKVVVSIFVNPAQFGPKEDFRKYPRSFSQDAALCRREGVDIIFYPSPRAMYPAGYNTYLEVKDLSNILCGKFRPGHFCGVATVVAKLFNIVLPERAYFGQKDAQQAAIIQRMVKDLNFPLRIIIVPTRREKDGLALSSRNIYLNKSERQSALALSRALNFSRQLIRKGNRSSASIIAKIKALIRKHPKAKVQYASVVDPENLKPLAKIKGRALIALAVYIGKTRLIDNIIVEA